MNYSSKTNFLPQSSTHFVSNQTMIFAKNEWNGFHHLTSRWQVGAVIGCSWTYRAGGEVLQGGEACLEVACIFPLPHLRPAFISFPLKDERQTFFLAQYDSQE